jgi:hypothetical protein
MGAIGIYFESWACPWEAKAEDLDLAKIDQKINLVNIAFVKPDCTYKKGSMRWDGTGLDFSMDFFVVKDAIAILKKRGVCVMLAVGGGAYWSTSKYCNYQGCVDLMSDLGCSGIDIDWEVGIKDAQSLVDVIPLFKKIIGSGYISFCGFSTGANPATPNDTTYSGMNLPAIKAHADKVDWINCMEYDAGKGFDVRGSYMNYRSVYKGPLNFGFEIGFQGWGDAILSKEDAAMGCAIVLNDGPKNGIFIWAYYSKPGSGASVGDVVSIAANVLRSSTSTIIPPAVVKPTYSCPSSVYVTNVCSSCKTVNRIKCAWSSE